MCEAQQAAGRVPGQPGWKFDLGIAFTLFALFVALRPAFPDGDGSSYAYNAITRDLFHPPNTKHVFYEGTLQLVFRLCEGLGLRSWALVAFTLVSNLAGAVLYLVLARGLYPVILRDVALGRICAVGAMLSLGLTASAATIENYAGATLFAAGIVAVCVRSGFTSLWSGAAIGGLFVLSVGFHVSGVLLLPFMTAFAFQGMRQHGLRPVLACAAVVALGAVLVLAGPYLYRAPGEGLFDILPKGDPQPSLSLPGRLGRAVYGIARTVAWLPPVSELTPRFAACYAAAAVGVLVVVGVMALRAFRNRGPQAGLVGYAVFLLAAPIALMGIAYYPSDPERWLVLVPAAWFVLGRVWLAAGAGLVARGFLLGLALAIGVFNVTTRFWPETRDNPDIAGCRALATVVRSGDLVIAPNRFDLVDEFVIGRPFECETLPLDVLMRTHQKDVAAGEAEVRRQVNKAIADGRRVYAFALVNENWVAGNGYPWAFGAVWGYDPAQFEKLLQEYRLREEVEPTPQRRGLYRLTLTLEGTRTGK